MPVPVKRREEESFKVVINVPASVIRQTMDHLLDVLDDDLLESGYPQAADLKIFILEKVIDRLEKEELEKNDN